ncbi:MAG: trypsin-like peptidase domain-containing protein [Clostridiales bacterium]|nr:trypsin-like peptidase domain-containing protein [Clostridiales bacterium]
MNDFTYYDNEPPKRRGLIAIAIVIIALAVAGVLVVQYVMPQINTTKSLQDIEVTSTTVVVTPTPEAVQTMEQITRIEVVEKSVTYIESGAIPDIVERVSPAIVGIINYTQTSDAAGFGRNAEVKEVPQASGSGVIITEDGYIVTNHHVIDGNTRITVTLTNGEVYNAEIIGSDRYVDLAVLKIDEKDLSYMEFGDSEVARAGELAIAIGYPLSDDFSAITVTAGILSAVGRDVEVGGINFEMLQTDAPINPGNSGGALVDGAGQLIGINTLKTLYAGSTSYGTTISAEGIGFAIPSHVVEPIVKDLMEEGEVVRPFIGISGRIITKADAEYYKLPQGMYIDELTENGPSEKAGLLVKDIITHVDGEPIVFFQDLFVAINESEVGDEMTFTIFRSDTEETLEITVVLESSKDY